MNFVLISGKAGVGKDTTASALSTYFEDVHIAHFADDVKRIAYSMGWDGKKDAAGRKLLQDIGRIGRQYNRDIWVSRTFNDVLDLYPLRDVVIIPDWRFPNEYTYLRKQDYVNVIKVRIVAPSRESLKGTPAAEDESETSLPNDNDDFPDNYYDFVINNEGTLDELEQNLVPLINKILEGV